MLSLYSNVAIRAARRAATSWPAALSLVVYAVIIFAAGMVLLNFGMIGGFIMGFVLAACWSSYIELLSQAVEGSRFRVSWEEFKGTFLRRLWDVISVMFALWILSLLTMPFVMSSHASQLSAMLGFAIAFFFNVVPELLYQGRSRSFALLLESARFVMEHPVAWFAPNLLFAALALWAGGHLDVGEPAELLILFGNTFSSPTGVVAIFAGLPLWALPLELLALHFVMIFRGILFHELSTGGGNARLREFQRGMRR
jgi:hypothetical protein